MSIHVGQKVRHQEIFGGKETVEIITIKKDIVELQGNFTGGIHNVEQTGWFPIKGLIFQNIWGVWKNPIFDIDFTKNSGQRD